MSAPAGTGGDATQYAGSLFEQPWWLDAVAPGRWGEALVRRGDEVAARMTYVRGGRLGVSRLSNPPLTPCMGPWLRPSTAKYANRLSDQHELLGELAAALPRADTVRLGLSPDLTNWLPFYWAGFQATLRYTYRIPDLSDLDRVRGEFQQATRNDIRRAEKRVVVRDDLGLDRFCDVRDLTFRRQGLRTPVGREALARLDAACAARGAREMLFAEDAEGRLHAAVYLVWDDRYTYYLMGGGDPELRSSAANSLLLWEALRRSAARTPGFDFEGSMLPGVERFFRGFGAVQVPWVTVFRESARGAVLGAATAAARRVRARMRDASG